MYLSRVEPEGLPLQTRSLTHEARMVPTLFAPVDEDTRRVYFDDEVCPECDLP